jgi:hypothetical protein
MEIMKCNFVIWQWQLNETSTVIFRNYKLNRIEPHWNIRKIENKNKPLYILYALYVFYLFPKKSKYSSQSELNYLNESVNFLSLL